MRDLLGADLRDRLVSDQGPVSLAVLQTVILLIDLLRGLTAE